MNSPRGLRNNNPLNIKKGDIWQGMSKTGNDPVFVQFDSIEYGYRAAFIILAKYIRKYKLNTIHQIVDRWAPDGEPYQSNYKKRVSDLMCQGVHIPIYFDDARQMISLVQAMAAVENGCIVDKAPIIRGYEMAKLTL